MFRRRRRDEEAQPKEAEAPGDVVVDEEPPPPAPGRPRGPWDVEDAPADPEGTQRLDLGGMQVPIVPGLEVRVDMDASQKVVAATMVDGGSALQINVFAAPRTDGIWDEVRAEILTSVETSGGGGGREVEGAFGTEVMARVPAGQPAPGKAAPLVDARFVGIDGPRWFVRGLFSGPAATDPAQAERLSEALRALVVVRGSDAMAPREPLPLVLPTNVAEAAAEAQAQAQSQQAAGGQPGGSAAPAAPPAAPPGQATGVPSRPQRSLQGHLAQAAQAARARAAAQAQAGEQGQRPAQGQGSVEGSAAAEGEPDGAAVPAVEPTQTLPAESTAPPEESALVELQPETTEHEGDDVGLDVLDQEPDGSR